MFVSYKWSIVYRAPWNLTQAYLLLLCLMRGNPVVWATWCLRHFIGPLQLGNKTPCKKVTPLKDLRMPWAFELDAKVHRKEKWGHTLVENVQFESDLKTWISEEQLQRCYLGQWQAAPPHPQGGGSVWFAPSLRCRYKMLLWIGRGLQLWFHSLGRKHFSMDRSWDYCSSGEGVLCTVSCTWTVPLH